MAVSPDGKTVYVSGQPGRGGGLPVVYSAATGRQLWASSYSGRDGGDSGNVGGDDVGGVPVQRHK